MLCATLKMTYIKKRTACILALTAIGLFFVWTSFLWRLFSCGLAGSYTCVESWDLKATEDEVINAIIELKKDNPSLQPPNQAELVSKRNVYYDWESEELKEKATKYLLDSLPLPPMTKTNTKSDYWLHIDFYYPDTKEIVHTWTRPDFDSTVTTFAFIGISSIKLETRQIIDGQPVNSNNDHNFKEINRDYGYFANKGQIWKFKNNILNLVKQKIEHRRKSGT